MKKYRYYDANPTYAHSYLVPMVEKILFSIKNKKFNNKKPYLLDIGCGNGSLCDHLTKMGFNVAGVDDSDEGIRIAKTKYPKITFIKKNIYNLTLNDVHKKFDIITATEVIEHFAEPMKLLGKVKEHLYSDGYLIISTPFHGYLKNISLALFNLWDRHFSAEWDSGHLRFFSVKSLRNILKKEGFVDIRFYFTGRFFPLWKSMICVSRLAK